MPLGQPKPTLASFLQTTRWTVSRAFLAKVGSARHDIRFVLLPDQPFLIHTKEDAFDPFWGVHFIHRTIDFSRIGVICVSGTSPSIREIVLTATISPSSPLFFGKSTALRSGFPERDEYGTGKSCSFRVDFTRVSDREASEADLLVLRPGHIAYPLSFAGAGIYNKALYDSHSDELFRDSVPISIFSPTEIEAVRECYWSLADELVLDVALILDSEELLAFHWSSSIGKFSEDFYNLSLTNAA